MTNKNSYDPAILDSVLPVYYKRLFPFDLYYRWLSYGSVNKNYFCNREFSLTLNSDIIIRYQSYASQKEFETDIISKAPHKIDIGAVYNSSPKIHRHMDTFAAQEKEVIIDIDITDYDDVRTCCKEGAICTLCWPLMSIAVKILDNALRNYFGFRNLLWVFSGRRGVHCWVADPEARKLSSSARSAIVGYLSLVKGGAYKSKKVSIHASKSLLKPCVQKALEIIDAYFDKLILEDQKILETSQQCQNFVKVAYDNYALQEYLLKDLLKAKDTKSRWRIFEANVESVKKTGKWWYRTVEEVKLQYCYPRLDVEVTKGLNHLLKGPFCVHPKTGQVSVPIDPAVVNDFDPTAVMNINSLLSEIDDYDRNQGDKEKKAVKDYQKTSYQYPREIFSEFLKQLETTWKGKLLEESDKKMEF